MTTMRWPSLLEQFLAEECSPHAVASIKAEVEAQARGGPALRRQFNFNRFEIEINFETREVAVIDILDAGEGGRQVVPPTDFVERLDKFASPTRPGVIP